MSTNCCKCNARGAAYFACYHTGPCGTCAEHSGQGAKDPYRDWVMPTDRELLTQILAELRALNALLHKSVNKISSGDDSYEHITFKEEG